MKILAIDTATSVASAAVVDDEKLLAEIIINDGKKHSEKLLPAIDHLLGDAGLDIDDIDAFCAVKGPGSFTGLRIGIATVKGFAQANHKPVVGISTLEALAANLLHTDAYLCPMLDARRRQVFTGVYYPKNDELKNIIPDTMMSVDALTAQLESLSSDMPIYLLGEAARLYGDELAVKLPNLKNAAPFLALNRASSAAALALKKLKNGEGADFKVLEPFYIRPSYAEEN